MNDTQPNSEKQAGDTARPAPVDWLARVRRKGYLRPGFLAAAAVLLAGLIGMQSLIWGMGLVLIKKPIALQKDLEELTTSFGPYELFKRQGRLPEAQEEALGTKEYISWLMRDTRKQEGEPGWLIRLHIPYYTGQIDSVPHVPDRCFVAGGAEANLKQIMPAELSGRGIRKDGARVIALTKQGREVSLPDDRVPMTVLRFANPDRPDDSFTVAYFFVANHDYVATPEGVRVKAFNPFDRYAYWSKVEVMPFAVGEPGPTRQIVQEFLSHALPEIMLCLPDWEKINAPPEPARAAMQ